MKQEHIKQLQDAQRDIEEAIRKFGNVSNELADIYNGTEEQEGAPYFGLLLTSVVPGDKEGYHDTYNVSVGQDVAIYNGLEENDYFNDEILPGYMMYQLVSKMKEDDNE